MERRSGTDSPPKNKRANGNVAEVAGKIRQGLLSGAYAPGQRLIETDLCEQLGCSRFIARVALQQLANEGLVEIERNKGARVRRVSVDEAIDITEVRMALEALAAACAAERATDEEAAELREMVAQMHQAVQSAELLTYSDLNARLHARIRALATNATLTETIERLLSQVVRHQFALALKPGRAPVSLVQHERIVESIAAHDPKEAEAAARRHLQSVIEELKSLQVSHTL